MKNYAVLASALICISLLSGCEKPPESVSIDMADTVSSITSVPADTADTVSSTTEEAAYSTENNEVTPDKYNTLLGENVISLELRVYDGQNITEQVIFDEEDLNEIQSMISAVPAEKAEEWSPRQIKLPVYGFEIISGDDSDLEAAWSDGYWITQDGEAYRLDFDFETLKGSYEWKYEKVWDHRIAAMPCAFFLCRDENGWITDHLEAAEDPVGSPEYITAELADQNDDTITVRLSNNSNDENGEGWIYNEAFRIDYFDEKWYPVPCIPGQKLYSRYGLIIFPRESAEITCFLGMYGGLPAGKYRLVGDNFAVEFMV